MLGFLTQYACPSPRNRERRAQPTAGSWLAAAPTDHQATVGSGDARLAAVPAAAESGGRHPLPQQLPEDTEFGPDVVSLASPAAPNGRRPQRRAQPHVLPRQHKLTPEELSFLVQNPCSKSLASAAPSWRRTPRQTSQLAVEGSLRQDAINFHKKWRVPGVDCEDTIESWRKWSGQGAPVPGPIGEPVVAVPPASEHDAVAPPPPDPSTLMAVPAEAPIGKYCIALPKTPQHDKFSRLRKGRAEHASPEHTQAARAPKKPRPKFNIGTLRRWFEEIDNDRSGKITRRELIVALRSHKELQEVLLCSANSRHTTAPSARVSCGTTIESARSKEGGSIQEQNQELKRILSILHQVDTDRSGSVEWDEFVELFRRGGFLLEYSTRDTWNYQKNGVPESDDSLEAQFASLKAGLSKGDLATAMEKYFAKFS